MAGRDPQERAKSSDRDAAMELIDRAHAEGRIGSADRTIRKNNVATAATLGELDMIIQDLADRPPGTVSEAGRAAGAAPDAGRLETPYVPDAGRVASASERIETQAAQPTVQVGGPPPAHEVPPSEYQLPPQAYMARKVMVTRGGGKAGVLLAVVAALVAVSMAGSIFLTRVGLPEIDLGTGGSATGQAFLDEYAMDEQGFAWVIDRYRESFGTTKSWQTIFYDGYVIFYAPNDDGSDSRQGWIYREGGFSEFGSAQFNPSGEQVVDLRRLDLKALVGSIERARTTLKVPDAEVSHIIVGPDLVSGKPGVTVYVGNGIGQHGFLQTDLSGKPVRDFPFSG